MGGSVRLDVEIDETPAYFSAGGEMLFGMFARPADDRSNSAVLLVPGGWYGTSSARNSLLVRMSRSLAASGLPCFRFDYHGIGESTGYLERFQLAKPLTEDVDGAVRWLRTQGVENLALVGVCVGARTALAAAARTAGVRALAMISVPVIEATRVAGGKTTERATRMTLRQLVRTAMRVEVLKGLLDYNVRRSYRTVALAKLRAVGRRLTRRRSAVPPHAEASDHFLDPFGAVVARDVPILLLYGEEDHYYDEFRTASAGRLGDLLKRAGPRVELEVPGAEVQSFSELSVQDAVIDLVEGWTVRHRDLIVASDA